MNPFALRLSEMGLQLEGAGMPEIVAALGVAEREIQRLDDECVKLRHTLAEANDKCRSAYQIAKRVVEQHGEVALGTNFRAFRDRVHESLMLQHVVLHPEQGECGHCDDKEHCARAYGICIRSLSAVAPPTVKASDA